MKRVMPACRVRPLSALLVSAATVGALLTGAGTASATAADGLCAGDWISKVAYVNFQRGDGGSLSWAVKLTYQARSALGPEVTVAMPYTYVNGAPINPPYQPHTEVNWYNFHGSLNKFGYIGKNRTGTINTGDVLTFSWHIRGSKPNATADGYIRCRVPSPGAH